MVGLGISCPILSSIGLSVLKEAVLFSKGCDGLSLKVPFLAHFSFHFYGKMPPSAFFQDTDLDHDKVNV